MVRADKARNQETVLAAAGRLFDAAGDPDEISMDAVAAAAGVGKGTLFRGFGDRLGLIRALYDQRYAAFEVELKPATDEGVPDRVYLLLSRLWQFKQRNRMLTLALERSGSGSPYQGASYEKAHAELVGLLGALNHADVRANAAYLAHALLAAVRSDLVEHVKDAPEEEIQQGLRVLVQKVTG